MIRPGKIVSGGQTGADQGALRAAKALGIPTGGWMPRSFRTEKGKEFWLRDAYGMREHPSSYMRPRTIANLMEADATVIYGETESPGSKLAVRHLELAEKPYRLNLRHDELYSWVSQMTQAVGRPVTLNVAGNRASVNYHLEAWVFAVLIWAWASPPRQIATPIHVPPKSSRAIPAEYPGLLDYRPGQEARRG
jgi:hypothetical protein